MLVVAPATFLVWDFLPRSRRPPTALSEEAQVRIALVTPHAAVPGSHPEPSQGPRVIPLAQALSRLGHEVTVYARRDSPRLPRPETVAPGVTIEHVTAGPATYLLADDLGPHIRSFGEHLARHWRQRQPEVVHAYSWPSGLAALAGARDLDVPVVQTFDSLDGVGGWHRLRQACEPLSHAKLKACLARSVHAVLARSSAEMRYLARVGVPRTSIHVVPWGVDTGHFTPDGPAAKRTGRPRLLTPWPVSGPSGAGVVIRALAGIPDAELVVVGGPPRGQITRHKVYRNLLWLAGKVRVDDRLSFTGEIGWPDLPPLLRSADLAVTMSWEGLYDPTALQVMACGTPVVAPAAGFYQDAVIDGTTGLLVPPGRPSLLARRIRALLASPLHMEAFGIAAADRARSRYAWDRIAHETVYAYQGCLPNAGAEDLPDEADLDPAGALAV